MWVTLIAQLVGQAVKPANIGATDASQFQVKTDPTVVFGIAAGAILIGGVLYWTLKQ